MESSSFHEAPEYSVTSAISGRGSYPGPPVLTSIPDLSESAVRVLIVEDNPGDAELITEMLSETESEAFTVNHADRMSAALEFLQTNLVDVVLLDLTLPDTTGQETIKTIRMHEADVPIIVLTGLDDQLVALDAMKNCAQDFLVKGNVNTESLGRAIKFAIERHRLIGPSGNRDDQRAVFARTELEVAERAKNRFLTNVSHELVTPLTGIVGSLQLVKRDQLSDRQHENVQRAIDNGQKLQDIISDIIQVSRAETNNLSLTSGLFPVRTLTKDIRKKYSPLAKERDLHFTVSLAEDVELIYADKSKVSYIFDELVENALKFTSAGMISADVKCDSRNLMIHVQDTGQGIPAQEQHRIFDAFQSDLNYLNHSGRGPGLGLAICQSYVDLMGGHLEITSEVGQGTSVIVVVPVGKPDLQAT